MPENKIGSLKRKPLTLKDFNLLVALILTVCLIIFIILFLLDIGNDQFFLIFYIILGYTMFRFIIYVVWDLVNIIYKRRK
jgi:hypothetical protein